MRVTSKGQVTIPIDIRNKYGITPGAEVEFVEGDEGPQIRVQQRTSQRPGDLVQALRRARKHVTHHLTTDQIMEMMRGEGEAVSAPK
jgi:AbrB family looped-hinge helix DNA binding protein